MSSVDVVDETFLAVPPARVAAEFADPASWRRFWPDLRLTVMSDRGARGFRWTVHGALVGSMEVWLEPVLDGTVLHYYLRADPPGRDGRPTPLPARRARAEVSRRQRAAKAIALGLKDLLEGGRPPGEAPPALPSPPTAPPPTPATGDPTRPTGAAPVVERGRDQPPDQATASVDRSSSAGFSGATGDVTGGGPRR
jgi:hypothetical protein